MSVELEFLIVLFLVLLLCCKSGPITRGGGYRFEGEPKNPIPPSKRKQV